VVELTKLSDLFIVSCFVSSSQPVPKGIDQTDLDLVIRIRSMGNLGLVVLLLRIADLAPPGR